MPVHHLPLAHSGLCLIGLTCALAFKLYFLDLGRPQPRDVGGFHAMLPRGLERLDRPEQLQLHIQKLELVTAWRRAERKN